MTLVFFIAGSQRRGDRDMDSGRKKSLRGGGGGGAGGPGGGQPGVDDDGGWSQVPQRPRNLYEKVDTNRIKSIGSKVMDADQMTFGPSSRGGNQFGGWGGKGSVGSRLSQTKEEPTTPQKNRYVDN